MERVKLIRRNKDKGNEEIDLHWPIPCDVRLQQSHTIPKGCSLKTLLTALHAIEGTRSGH